MLQHGSVVESGVNKMDRSFVRLMMPCTALSLSLYEVIDLTCLCTLSIHHR